MLLLLNFYLFNVTFCNIVTFVDRCTHEYPYTVCVLWYLFHPPFKNYSFDTYSSNLVISANTHTSLYFLSEVYKEIFCVPTFLLVKSIPFGFYTYCIAEKNYSILDVTLLDCGTSLDFPDLFFINICYRNFTLKNTYELSQKYHNTYFKTTDYLVFLGHHP
jgi:hypothetical protein